MRFSSLQVDLQKARLVLGLHEYELKEEWTKLLAKTLVGRLFGADDATDKGTSEDLLAFCRRLFPEVFSNGFPEVWVLPRHALELRAAMAASPRTPFLIKPRDSSEGNGIRLLLESSDLGHADQQNIVQRYIARPLLLGGLKFDLRLYVLVKSLQPLDMWLCREGLVRFCTEQYETPTKRNLHKVTSFLTNYSLNKRAPGYVHSDDAHGGSGSKRSLSSTMPLILEALAGMDEDEMWLRLQSVVLRGLLPLLPFLLDAERQQRQRHRHGMQFDASAGPFFSQIMGVDVLLDNDGAAWLLEANSFPSMSLNCTVPFHGEGKCCRCMDDYNPHTHVESAVDRHVKMIAIRGALRLWLGRPQIGPRVGGQGVVHDDFDHADGGDIAEGVDAGVDAGVNTRGLNGATGQESYMPLVCDEVMESMVELLTSLAEVFGRCCKAGSSTADPFRLRKLFGADSREADLRLRQLAQQPQGLTMLPVSNLLCDWLSSTRGELPLVEALLVALREAG